MNDLTSLYVGRSGGLNPNLKFLLDERVRGFWKIFVLQGGTRSGKTYSIVKFVIWVVENFTGLTISICRATLPSLKASILRDFQEVMLDENLWSDRAFNKSSLEYRYNGNLIEFFSVDDEQKVRGRKRDILIVNEANQVSEEKMQQLLFRTTTQVIIDFNPSMVSSYIYDIIDRNDAALVITTYKDNPHLPQAIIEEIELLKIKDPDMWQVYGCGQRGTNRAGLIYPNWSEGEFRYDLPCWYGVDFGFSNDPTAIVCIAFDRKETIYVHEVCYRKGLQNSDIANIIKQDFKTRRAVLYDDGEVSVVSENGIVCGPGFSVPIDGVQNNHSDIGVCLQKHRIPQQVINGIILQLKHIERLETEVYFDSAEPKSIAEMRLYGIKAHPCLKGVGSITSQIQFVKNFKVIYSHESDNIRREATEYKWLQRKDSQKEFENQPQAGNDHLMDAIRYGVYTHLSRNYETFKSISQIKESRTTRS